MRTVEAWVKITWFCDTEVEQSASPRTQIRSAVVPTLLMLVFGLVSTKVLDDVSLNIAAMSSKVPNAEVEKVVLISAVVHVTGAGEYHPIASPKLAALSTGATVLARFNDAESIVLPAKLDVSYFTPPKSIAQSAKNPLVFLISNPRKLTNCPLLEPLNCPRIATSLLPKFGVKIAIAWVLVGVTVGVEVTAAGVLVTVPVAVKVAVAVLVAVTVNVAVTVGVAVGVEVEFSHTSASRNIAFPLANCPQVTLET